jgi:hypothetical protein
MTTGDLADEFQAADDGRVVTGPVVSASDVGAGEWFNIRVRTMLHKAASA